MDSNEKGEKIKAQHINLNPDIYVRYYQGDVKETHIDFARNEELEVIGEHLITTKVK